MTPVPLAPSGAYLQELEGQLGDNPESQWWDADNVWLPDQKIVIDCISNQTVGPRYAISAWNNVFGNSDAADDLVDYHHVIALDSDYVPGGTKAAIGSRYIVGSTAMQVAAWDYYGNPRPSSEVQAGAVQEYYVSSDRTPPPVPDYPY